MYLDHDEVLMAIERGYTQFDDSSEEEMSAYFSELSEESMDGHISNVKGIALEMELERELDGELFELTNHAGTDIIIDGQEYSVKSGVSIQGTNDDLSEGLQVIATSEIASITDASDAGISNVDLTEQVQDVFSVLCM